MKKYISFSCLLLLMFAACSAFRNKPNVNVSNLSGEYINAHDVELTKLADWGHETETAKLTLNPDSTFQLYIDLAYNELPGEYYGTWKLHADEIILVDTTRIANNVFRFRVNEDGSLTGKCHDSEQIFNSTTK